MDFEKLKRSRSTESLTKEVLKVSQPTEGVYEKDDERFWQPEVDKAGNGMAIIRFLPAPAADAMTLFLGFVVSITHFRELVAG